LRVTLEVRAHPDAPPRSPSLPVATSLRSPREVGKAAVGQLSWGLPLPQRIHRRAGSASSVWRSPCTLALPPPPGVTPGARRPLERGSWGLPCCDRPGGAPKSTTRFPLAESAPLQSLTTCRSPRTCCSCAEPPSRFCAPPALEAAQVHPHRACLTRLRRRPQGFSPSRRLAPCTALRPCFVPLALMGFNPSELLPPDEAVAPLDARNPLAVSRGGSRHHDTDLRAWHLAGVRHPCARCYPLAGPLLSWV
jgi:hypothetical protein